MKIDKIFFWNFFFFYYFNFIILPMLIDWYFSRLFIILTSSSEKKAFTLLMSFSLKRNASSFFKTHGDKKPDNPFMFLHGVKFVSMVLIVFVHKSAYGLFAVTYNREALENLLYSVHKNFLPQGDLTVDTFFFITGLIATYMMLEVLEKKRINFFVMFFARFIRWVDEKRYFFKTYFHSLYNYIYFLSNKVWKSLGNDC